MDIVVDSGAVVCAIVAIGMSVAFLVAEYRSTSTRLLSLFLASVGLSILFNISFVRPYAPEALPWPSRITPLLTALAVVAVAEWVLRIRRTVPAGNLKTRYGDAMFRVGQGLALLYGVTGFVLNEWRARYFVGNLDQLADLHDWQFWLFALPLGLAVLALMEGTTVTLRRKPDRPEAVRLLGIAISAPLIASGLVLPAPYAAYGSALGQMIFLIAAVQYHVLQGQRGQFLKRFLSPSVAELVRREGLGSAMQQQKLQISVVAVDLRGYTAYSEAHDSARVIEVLHGFYDVVGAQARACEATIKDYAGDGVLLLIGAPIPVREHAARAVELARAIRSSVESHFAAAGVDLGVGAGIATGAVSVGVIGKERLEYVAVGRAINLAARLCQHARAGEVLMDEPTRQALGPEDQTLAAPEVEFKGIAGRMVPWMLSSV